MSTKLSVCVIAKNEEAVIGRCLDSVRAAADEIIVVLDGRPTDNTEEICRAYTDKVFIRPRRENFNSHRVFSYERARGEWILQIDADEYLSAEIRQALPALLNRPGVGAYEFLWPYWSGREQLTRRWPYKRCLFRRSEMSFIGIINYIPAVRSTVRRSDLVLHHRPAYDNFSLAAWREKWLTKAALQARLYLAPFAELEKFQYSGEDWPGRIRLRLRWPLASLAPDFFLELARQLRSGAWREGPRGLRFALMAAVYKLMTDYYIYRYKRVVDSGK